ncbi:hypothetical protein EAG_11899 [Camponotus floridanus]|uniref:Uncharacterized protein n=1 Tax=Camponotus floridanus TaxID=104421 RepID=E2A515_CAMFO|nr:hypothetical protein EAG_11899 [Camponotus floridanus]
MKRNLPNQGVNETVPTAAWHRNAASLMVPPDRRPNNWRNATRGYLNTQVKYSGVSKRRYKKQLLREGGATKAQIHPAEVNSSPGPSSGGAPTVVLKRARSGNNIPSTIDTRQSKRPKINDQGSYVQTTKRLALILESFSNKQLGAADFGLIRKMIRGPSETALHGCTRERTRQRYTAVRESERDSATRLYARVNETALYGCTQERARQHYTAVRESKRDSATRLYARVNETALYGCTQERARQHYTAVRESKRDTMQEHTRLSEVRVTKEAPPIHEKVEALGYVLALALNRLSS